MAPVQSTLFHLDQTIAVATAALLVIRKRRRRKKRWNVHPIWQRRSLTGAFGTLGQELKEFDEKFREYYRLTEDQFTHVLNLIREDISKQHHSRGDVISASERLSVTLRYLATGESYHSLSFAYKIGVTTVAQIVPQVCDAIWNNLSPIYVKVPSTPEEWKDIAKRYWEKWQFPQCLGSIDGKHVVMMKPWNSGSQFFNYKGTCSTILMALVDADLRFIALDIGSYGRNSDGGVFARSAFGERFVRKSFNFPDDAMLPNYPGGGLLPYVAVGDEAFPLMENLLRPYPGQQNALNKQLFNYRLSRARRVVENAFGVLAVRWRVFHTKIAVRPEVSDLVVKASCALHNMLQGETTAAQVTRLLRDAPNPEDIEGLQPMYAIGNRSGERAMAVHDAYKDFFVQDESVPWQQDHVLRGRF